jgi:hypothetical protein
MKHKAKIAAHRRHLQRAKATPSAPPRRQRPARRWLAALVLVGCFLGAGFATFALFEFALTRVPSALVGKWIVRGGMQDGVTLEFRHNGAFRALVNRGGQVADVEGRAEADEKFVHLFSVNPLTGKEEAKTHLLNMLTDKELVLEDPTGVRSTLIRVE